ncbi:phage tail tape measure protein [Roseibium sp. RKSG952]|uniref:phage tail tape measure protein n=1 Tax=Roseibium sp. RKSG952 TaxID=2529384 RepID=UPI0012BBEF83|nr:phage tail tape measure protein [Roseibium sp. RKSG952]MTH96084.1 phage tail tape measure protein [Roseibium sp. RKSG952]
MTEEPIMDVPLEELERFSEQMAEIRVSAEGVSNTLTRGLKSALVDGKSLDSVFRQMALSLSSRLVNASLKPLENLAGDAVGGLFSGLSSGLSGAASNGFSALLSGVTPFAKGGVVATPSYFAMAGGGLGLMGEAGAEAILPLARGADGRLGVRTGRSAMGPDGKTPPVQVTITTRDAESFRRSEAQVSAMVARAVGRGRRGL